MSWFFWAFSVRHSFFLLFGLLWFMEVDRSFSVVVYYYFYWNYWCRIWNSWNALLGLELLKSVIRECSADVSHWNKNKNTERDCRSNCEILQIRNFSFWLNNIKIRVKKMSHTVCIPSSIYDKVFENRIKFRMKINSIFKATKKMERIKGTSTWDTNHDGKIWICNKYYAIHAHKCENLRFFCF